MSHEIAATMMIKAIPAGMQVSILPEDWPDVRPVVDMQATVWESEGLVLYAAMLRAEISRMDEGRPRSNTHMIVLEN